ncbi:hypothetical protein [Methylobacterium dankookense]|uniref:Uncharacterized protein n=1 Tax=Methylobacterium dankookense TaxID=560405 RepID=A0A564FQX1_9HYPH|nr:hypothetical protein [Methylobacterium dankookense]GJD58103.1 hypothetical protein IFDJLNFL_4018 [Methylobacterium dankookense]VUF10472.1 hypothetical protein MTDSW087_00139 [Methylobacterium dankookense]
MRVGFTAFILGLMLTAGHAAAQAPAAAPPGAGPKAGRVITATGQTKPPGGGAAAPMKPVNEAEMLKAQKAAAARDKAWDAKMRTTLGSICRGC